MTLLITRYRGELVYIIPRNAQDVRAVAQVVVFRGANQTKLGFDGNQYCFVRSEVVRKISGTLERYIAEGRHSRKW